MHQIRFSSFTSDHAGVLGICIAVQVVCCRNNVPIPGAEGTHARPARPLRQPAALRSRDLEVRRPDWILSGHVSVPGPRDAQHMPCVYYL